MGTWKESLEKEFDGVSSLDWAIDIYNRYVEDSEEFEFASEPEFQGALAWLHNAICKRFSISRERFSLLRMGGHGWSHKESGAKLVVFDEVIYFVGKMIHFETSGDAYKPAPKANPEWKFVIEENTNLDIPKKVFECEKIVFENGSFHESFWYGGYIIPDWLAQIIVESNPE